MNICTFCLIHFGNKTALNGHLGGCNSKRKINEDNSNIRNSKARSAASPSQYDYEPVDEYHPQDPNERFDGSSDDGIEVFNFISSFFFSA